MLILVDNRIINTDQIIKIEIVDYDDEPEQVRVCLPGSYDVDNDCFFDTDSDAGRALIWWFRDVNRNTIGLANPNVTLDVVEAWREATKQGKDTP
jgi:hypothetical protein